jgi:hypothetical protein
VSDFVAFRASMGFVIAIGCIMHGSSLGYHCTYIMQFLGFLDHSDIVAFSEANYVHEALQLLDSKFSDCKFFG